MTRDDDAALAEAIGWTQIDKPYHGDGTWWAREPGKAIATSHRVELPTYATAPTGNTMLQLIEGLAGEEHGGWKVGIMARGPHEFFARFSQELGPPATWVVFDAWVDTLPAAVCQAALRAIGKGGEE